MRNRPIRQLIKWFVNREKGKVVDARSEIRRRFPYIDWSDQKKFLLASLSSGQTDRTWAYRQLVRYWDDSLFPKAKEVWEKFHDTEMIQPAIMCFPEDYVKSELKEFSDSRNIYAYIYHRRFIVDPNYVIERNNFSAYQYLMLMRHGMRCISNDEALSLLYEHILHLINIPARTIVINGYLCRGVDIDQEDFPTVMEFRSIYAMVRATEELGNVDVVQNFYHWAGDAYMNFVQSEEYPALIAEEVGPNRVFDKKIFLAKKMMYNAIPDKYKEMWYDAIPVEYKKQECVWHTPIVTSVRSYLGFYKMIDEKYLPPSKASSEQIKDMMKKTPAIASLIENFGIEVEDNVDCPF